jgi:hypothetical protein
VGTEEQSSPLPDNDIQLVNLFEQIDLLSFFRSLSSNCHLIVG